MNWFISYISLIFMIGGGVLLITGVAFDVMNFGTRRRITFVYLGAGLLILVLGFCLSMSSKPAERNQLPRMSMMIQLGERL